uniref:DUF1985 domain-containing protein n=1 Tax=Lactuca sativa TaxID=4236 RepID=A0A9R1VJK4_LACSA|nr:hypothetical protein LSAT_V11C500263170 [Lactuca sativa]
MFLCFLQHDFSYFNVKAIVNLKGSRDIFRDTIFGYLLDVTRLQGDVLLFHKMFLHQIRPDPILSPDGIKRLYFRVGNTKMVYGLEEFCLITGFNFGEYPQNIGKKVSEKLVTSKKRCLLRERLFSNHTNSSVKIGDLKSLILNQTFLEVDDADAARVCLIYILCEDFLGKEINDRVPQDCFFFAKNLDVWNMYISFTLKLSLGFTYDDLEDTWNKINKYLLLPERCQTLKYSISGFTGPIRIWIYEMLPVVRACGYVLRKNRDMPRMKRWSGTKKLKWVDVNKIFSKIQEGQPLRQNMLSSDGEMTSCYYMSFQEYVYGERKSVSSPVRDHFKRQDESSSSMSSSGRSHGRGRGSEKHNLDEVLKRLHVLEQHVFMNRQPTSVFVEEVNNEDFWKDISFEEPVVFQGKYDEHELEERNDNAGNKFDDDVFDVNDYNEAKEVSDEDEVIITGNVDYYDDYGVDGKEVTPDKPRTRKPSQYLCPPYIELHTTPKQKRRAKKKVDIKSTSPVPPPAFAVTHDFSVLCLQPYVAGSEVVIQNYLFHSYDVQHRLFNFVLDRDFWSVLFGHTHDGWLESMKDRIGGRLWLVLLRTPTSWLLVGMSIRSYCRFIHPLITDYLGNYDWRQWKSIFMTVLVEWLIKNSNLMERLPNLNLGCQIIWTRLAIGPEGTSQGFH